MDTSEDGLNAVIGITKDVTGKSLDILSGSLKELLRLAIENKSKMKGGKNNLEILLNSTNNLSEIPIDKENIKSIMKECKKNALPVACIKNPDNTYKLLYRTDEKDRLASVIESNINARLNIKTDSEKANIGKGVEEVIAKGSSQKQDLLTKALNEEFYNITKPFEKVEKGTEYMVQFEIDKPKEIQQDDSKWIAAVPKDDMKSFKEKDNIEKKIENVKNTKKDFNENMDKKENNKWATISKEDIKSIKEKGNIAKKVERVKKTLASKPLNDKKLKTKNMSR